MQRDGRPVPYEENRYRVLRQIPNYYAQQNDTERVRQGTKTDHVRHDLAVGPADKFQFHDPLMKADSP